MRRVQRPAEAPARNDVSGEGRIDIAFGRAICGDLATAERREWLVTNGLGGFASGTIAGTLTRRYHGLLIAALHPPVGRTLLVTKLDESARYRGVSFELATNRWKDGYLSPQGFTLIERFRLEGTMPVWHFAIGDALLEKRIWMEHGENTTYVRYRLLRAAAPLDLTLKALVNARSFHANTHADDGTTGVVRHERGFSASPKDASHHVFVVADRDVDVQVENIWYRDFALAEETRRGLDDRDDNLAAGNLSLTLDPGEAATISCSVAETVTREDDALQRREEHDRAVLAAWQATPHAADAPRWMARCVLAADQFVVARPLDADPEALSVIAGYHWFDDWSRDTMISLPGLALVTGRPEVAKKVLTTFAHFVDGGMLPNYFPDGGESPQYNTVDAALWYVDAVARYVEATDDLETLAHLWPSLQSIVASYRSGSRYGIVMDDDGLIVASDPGLQLTWMDAKVGDWVVTPRMGKPIEVAALWYNALRRMQVLAGRLGVSAGDCGELAQRAAHGFDRFWNAETGYCYDVLDGPGGNDASLRPNQIFAVALHHSPLDPQRQRAVVDVCAAEFLTTNGLRSLARSDPRFTPRYEGSPRNRDGAYHQGTAWAWLLGPFAMAHMRVYGDSDTARSFLEPLVDQFFDCGLGSIGEIADATAPFTPRGAIAQAWSVAELLRAWHDVL